MYRAPLSTATAYDWRQTYQHALALVLAVRQLFRDEVKTPLHRHQASLDLPDRPGLSRNHSRRWGKYP
jgi:hypothetical protein